jgi:hypothetical protein
MFLKRYLNQLVAVFVIVVGILIYTYYKNNMALGLTIIYCDTDFETIANTLVNFVRDNETVADKLMVSLSNLEECQHLVVVSNFGYDIDSNNPNLFFQMFFQSQDLSIEQVNGVFLNVIKVYNVTYTVHPSYINFILDLFKDIIY